MDYKAKAAPQKKEAVKQLVELLKKYKVIAVVDMENLPAKQLQQMRQGLRGSVVLRMSKRNIITLALDEVKEKKDLEKLKEHLGGMPAIMFTNDEPFQLYKQLQKSKSKAPIKTGQIAPEDLIVKAGPTGFPAGPMISEFATIGIKAKVDAGKIAVVQDTVVAKKGDKVSAKVAAVLARLDMKPMDIGLNLKVAYDEGIIYTKDVLAVDETQYLNNVLLLHAQAFALAMHIRYPAREVIVELIKKAQRESRALSIGVLFPTSDTIGIILAKAEMQAAALKATAGQ